MAYNYITNRTSPNFWAGGNNIRELVIHWWGDPNQNPTAEGVVNHLCNPATQVSAHYVITGTGRRVWQLVNDRDRAWHALAANQFSLGLELDPRCRDEDYDVAAEVIADLWKYYGKLPLVPHNRHVATQCPGNYDLGRLQRLAEIKLNPAPTPAPTPPSIKYQEVPAKSIELVRDASMWNFNFNKWPDAKPVKAYKQGDVIENIVAIATNSLGAKYYVTKYSYDSKVTNGFNINDAKDYVAPVTPPKPPVTPPSPEPEPELPVTEKPDYEELEKRVSALEALVKTIVDFLSSVFKGFKEK